VRHPSLHAHDTHTNSRSPGRARADGVQQRDRLSTTRRHVDNEHYNIYTTEQPQLLDKRLERHVHPQHHHLHMTHTPAVARPGGTERTSCSRETVSRRRDDTCTITITTCTQRSSFSYWARGWNVTCTPTPLLAHDTQPESSSPLERAEQTPRSRETVSQRRDDKGTMIITTCTQRSSLGHWLGKSDTTDTHPTPPYQESY
jgi:hypothetical protein